MVHVPSSPVANSWHCSWDVIGAVTEAYCLVNYQLCSLWIIDISEFILRTLVRTHNIEKNVMYNIFKYEIQTIITTQCRIRTVSLIL